MARGTRTLIAALAALGIGMPGPGASRARASVSFGAGADYASGPGAQSVRDAMGYAQAGAGRADATVALARFNSSQVGTGTNTAAALTWAASPKLSLQILAAHAVAERDYRSTRVQAGPVLPFGAGTWGIFTTRADDTYGPSTTGISTEVSVPLTPSLIALGRGSLASVDGGGTNLQGAAGLIWGASKRVVFVGELGMGRDATALSPGAPAQGGGFVTERTAGGARDYVAGPALSVGVRYVIH